MRIFQLLFFTILFCFEVSICAQNKKDSLLVILSKSEDKEKVDILNNLSSHLLWMELDSAKDYLDESIEYARDIKYLKGETRAMATLANYFSLKTEYFKADSLLQKATKLATLISDEEEQSRIKLVQGINFSAQGKLSEAMQVQLEVLEYAEKAKDYDLQVSCLNNIGFLQQKTNNIEEASTYFYQSLEIAQERNFKLRIGEIHLNLGVLEYLKNNLGLSIEHNQKAYEFLKYLNANAAAKALNNLGFAHHKLGDSKKAMFYYDESLVLRKKNGDKRGHAKVLQNQAKVLYENDVKQSLTLINESIEIAKAVNNFELKRDGYHFLYKHFQDSKNYENALNYYKLFRDNQDSILQRANAIKIKKEFSKYKLSELENANHLMSLRLKNRNQLIVIVLLCLVVIFMLFIAYRRKTKKVLKDKSDKIEEIQNKHKLESLEYENHRIKLNSKIEALENDVSNEHLIIIIDNTRKAILDNKDWVGFLIYFEKLYPEFYNRLKQEKPIDLTINEQRLIAMIKINLTNKEISSILSISPASVVKAKARLKDKLEFDSIEKMLLFFRSF